MGQLNLFNILKIFILSVISWPTCEWHHPDRLTATCPTLFNQADVANLENTSIWHRTTSAPWQIRTIRQLMGHLVTSFLKNLEFELNLRDLQKRYLFTNGLIFATVCLTSTVTRATRNIRYSTRSPELAQSKSICVPTILPFSLQSLLIIHRY